jgi:hypothetical protein
MTELEHSDRILGTSHYTTRCKPSVFVPSARLMRHSSHRCNISMCKRSV